MATRAGLCLWGLGITLLIGGLMQGAFGIKCYICNSEYDKENCKVIPRDRLPKDCTDWCKENPNELHIPPSYVAPPGYDASLTGCPIANFTSCRKSVFKISSSANPHDNNDETRIVRACGFLGNHTQQQYKRRAVGGGLQSEIVACFADGCNTAMSTVKQISILVATVVAVAAVCL